MMPTLIQSLALVSMAGLLIAVLTGSVVAWSHWLGTYWNGARLKFVAPGPQATVGAIDILVTLLVLFALFVTASLVWRTIGLSERATQLEAGLDSADPPGAESLDRIPFDTSVVAIPGKPVELTQNQFLFSGFAITAQLVCVFFMTVFVRVRTGCSFKKLGWRNDQIAGDLGAGFRCFLMLTPIILIMNGILQGLTKTPYEHPIQEMIARYPWLLGIAFWQAAIVAPISEEFAFRVLLIGWFESIQIGRDKVAAFLFGAKLETPEGVQSTVAAVEPIDIAYKAAWWPVLLSGTLFGLAHFSYGVSWVPLIVFGVVLGRLYQMRQSILPVITVHVLFNAMNVLLLGLALLLQANRG